MSFEFKITEKIQNLEFKTASAKEIALKLGMQSALEISEVTKALNKMVEDGSLEFAGAGKYAKAQIPITIRGVLRGNRRGFAFLIREDGGEDIFVPNKSLNGAIHGDTVTVKIVRGDEGKVTAILERGIKRLIGVFQKSKDFGFVVPDNSSYFKDVFIAKKDNLDADNNTKVVVEIIGYGTNPEGRIVEIIGNADEKQSEVLSILKAQNFFNYFPSEVEDEAKAKQYEPVTNRTSYVGLPTITIDGEDSKDLDDAISLVRVGNNFKLYVHIADVSHYVQYGSVLDEEAFKRCTSVYFPGSVYPMLPKILSNGLCSLNEGEDRLALTCVMSIDRQGEVVHSELVKSLINNTHRMTYSDVTKILGGDTALKEKYADIVPMIADMAELSTILKAKRDLRGSINFETKECKIYLDENGDVDKIEQYPYTVANEIIEEFMLSANETVAKIMCEKDLPFVYRVHEKPDGEKIIAFKAFAGSLGYVLPDVEDITPKQLQELLDKIQGAPLEAVISKVMLRSMKKAKYTTECVGHFGLAAEYYCHFTSPIRRYPDLQIHRIIKDMLDDTLGSIPKLAKWCKEVADTSSERERAAELAEREIDDFYKTEYMLKHVGEEYSGVVSGVTSFGIFIELPNTCEGLARLDNLPQDNYNFVEERFSMQGAYHSYTLGQTVRIKVLDCNSQERRVSFNVLEESIEEQKRLEGQAKNTINQLNGGGESSAQGGFKGGKKYGNGDNRPKGQFGKTGSSGGGKPYGGGKSSGGKPFGGKPNSGKPNGTQPNKNRGQSK